MKINIYYGGRGLIGDPTLYVLNKIQEVLRELNVSVERYDLYEFKSNIVTLPQTLKDTDGIILATTVEWYGIGGYMQQFLDSCWLYGDKEKIANIYMCPVVMARPTVSTMRSRRSPRRGRSSEDAPSPGSAVTSRKSRNWSRMRATTE